MPTITFDPSEKSLVVEEGTSILTAAIEAEQTGVECCGIIQACGMCSVDILSGEENLTPPDALEAEHRKRNKFPPFRRLGCMAHILGDVRVEVAR